MLREELIKAGFTEEQATSAERLFNRALDNEYVPKHRFVELNTKKQNLETEFEAYKQSNPPTADLQKKVKDLETQLETQKTEYETVETNRKKKDAIRPLIAGKVHDEDVAMGLIPWDKVVLDDKGKATGADALVKEFQTKYPYMCKAAATKGTAEASSGNPPAAEPESYAVQLAKQRLGQQAVADQAKNYFN